MSEAGQPKKPDEIEAIVDQILADFTDVLPADMFEDAREFILDAFAAHPVARPIANRLRERASPEATGEEPTYGTGATDDAAGKGKASGGDR